jgi:uncharacterized protein (DUF1499 family)
VGHRPIALGEVIAILALMPLFSCAGTRPANLGVAHGRLAACPSSPNCVSSDAEDSRHGIPPFELTVPSDAGWRAVLTAVAELPRTVVISQTEDYLHAECGSALLGFVDDLELQLRPDHGVVAVRSASRLGYSDMGANRNRVEDLRTALREHGAIR